MTRGYRVEGAALTTFGRLSLALCAPLGLALVCALGSAGWAANAQTFNPAKLAAQKPAMFQPFAPKADPPPDPLVDVPLFRGATLGMAKQMAETAHLGLKLEGPTDDAARVVDQDLQPGQHVGKGRIVTLSTSDATPPPPTDTIPAFHGLTVSEAAQKAQDTHFTLQFSGPTDPDARVDTQAPDAGSPAPNTTIVTLYMMDPPPPVTAPSLRGLNAGAAEVAASNAGLRVRFVGPTDAAAKVVDQDPPAETPMPPNSLIVATLADPQKPWAALTLALGAAIVVAGGGAVLQASAQARCLTRIRAGLAITPHPDAGASRVVYRLTAKSEPRDV